MTEETTSREAPGDVHALLERIEEAWRSCLPLWTTSLRTG